jgi:hypothetical protein
VDTSLAALGAVVSLLASAPAQAGPPPTVSLVWNAPAGCPAKEEVVAEVEHILGASPRREARATATVEQRADDRWSVRIETDTDGTEGERSIEAGSCGSLASATALVLALTMEGERTLTASLPPPVVAEPVVLTQRSSARVRGMAAASGALDLGTLPHLAVATEVTLGIVIGAARLELEGSGWGAENAEPHVEGTRLQLWEAHARGCFRGRVAARLEVDPCLAAGVAYVTSNGFDESSTKNDASTAWPEAEAGVVARLAVFGPVGLRAGFFAEVPFARPMFYFVDAAGADTLLHRPSAFAGRGALGVEVAFP